MQPFGSTGLLFKLKLKLVCRVNPEATDALSVCSDGEMGRANRPAEITASESVARPATNICEEAREIAPL